MPRLLNWLLAGLTPVAIAQSGKTPVLSTVTGEVVQANGKPSPEALVWWESASGIARSANVRADALGRFDLNLAPGAYRVCAVPAIREPAARTLPAGACYPSIPIDARRAAAVVQAIPGESTGPLRISLGEEKVFAIKGRIVTKVTKTRDWGTSVWAIADRSHIPIGNLLPSRDYFEGRVDHKSGAFVIPGLPAGSYEILARTGLPLACDTCAMPPRFQSVVKTRVDRDVSGLVVAIYPNTSVAGHLTFDGKDSPPSGNEQHISLDSGAPSYFSLALLSTADANGHFRIDQVPPGDYTVTALRESEYLSTLFQKGKPAPGNRIRIVPGSSPAIEIVARTATAAVEVKVEGDWRSWPSSPLSVVAIPDDGWDDPYSWTGPVWYDTRPVALRVGRPGSYLIFATQNLSGHVIEAWADELRRHEKQAVRVIVKDGLVETVTLRPVVLDATDVGASQSK